MRTTASVGGHPVHMMVVHFPMAFLMGSAAFGRRRGSRTAPAMNVLLLELLAVALLLMISGLFGGSLVLEEIA